MGIQGLLPFLKDIQVKVHVSEFRGQTVGVDAYCWLHKGAYACAKDLVMNKPTKMYVNYVMKRVNMLLAFNLTPILVFDGGHLPAKKDTEKDRRQRRAENKARGLAALREGKTSEAYDFFQKCTEITPQMAADVISECYSRNVQCTVAPYEADAQLAYLMKHQITDFTISEDSDLLIYGCDKVLFKMSAEGDGNFIDLANLPKLRNVQLASFTIEKFRHLCMLSGCDYLPSVKGMGLMKAYQSLRRHPTVYDSIKSLKVNPKFNVPEGYADDFRKADMVFMYQLVFDPRSSKIVPLNPVNDLHVLTEDDRRYAGPLISDHLALQIALGNVDPLSGNVMAHRTDFPAISLNKQSTSKKTSEVVPDSLDDLTPSDSASCNKRSVGKPPHQRSLNKALKKVASESVLPCSSAREQVPPRSDSGTAKGEASQSLKRLRIEDEDFVSGREEKLRKLYESVMPAASPVAPRHFSAFSKKPNHKFKNPFRSPSGNVSATDRIIQSRYFGGQSRAEDDHVQSTPIDSSGLLDSPEEKSVDGASPPDECHALPEPTSCSPTGCRLDSHPRSNFLVYLDKHNLRSVEKKDRLTLFRNEKSPKGSRRSAPTPMAFFKACSDPRSSVVSTSSCKGAVDVESNLTSSSSCQDLRMPEDDQVNNLVDFTVVSDPVRDNAKKSSNQLLARAHEKAVDVGIMNSSEAIAFPTALSSGTVSPTGGATQRFAKNIRRNPPVARTSGKVKVPKEDTRGQVYITSILQRFKREVPSDKCVQRGKDHLDEAETVVKGSEARDKEVNCENDQCAVLNSIMRTPSPKAVDRGTPPLPELGPSLLGHSVNDSSRDRHVANSKGTGSTCSGRSSENRLPSGPGGKTMRCKSVGLSRKIKLGDRLTNSENVKPSRITLDRFCFTKKLLTRANSDLSPDEGNEVICIS